VPKKFVGRYDTIKRKSFRDEMTRQERIEQDIMDLAPEIHLLRTLVVDFVNRYQRFRKALFKWYTDGESSTKPRKILDIADAGNLIDKVSKVVERMHKIRSTGSISLDTFKRVSENMGLVVANQAQRHFGKKDAEAVVAFLQGVEADWSRLAMDSKNSFADELKEEDVEDDDNGPSERL